MISAKKLATIGVSAALFASTAMPALAWGGSEIEVEQSNSAFVLNHVNASSNTGAGDDIKGAKVRTGNADTIVTIDNAVNGNFAVVKNCGCNSWHGSEVEVEQNNRAGVINSVNASSSTGAGDDIRGYKVKTGAAYTGVAVSNLVNANVAVVH